MQAIQKKAVGRLCGVCHAHERSSIEAALLTPGRNLSQLSREFGISEDALRRHWNTHTAPAVKESMETATEGLSALSIAARMIDLAQAASDIRRRSIDQGKDAIALRAIDTERATLSTISEMLGIPANAALGELKMMERVGAAMAQIARHDSKTGEIIAAQFDAAGRPDIAEDLRSIYPETKASISA